MAKSNKNMSNSPIYLGFGASVEPEMLYRLRAHYLPLGKIGGRPSWLNPIALPSADKMTCKVCGKALAFLLQVYATSASDAEFSFHRSIFFFICRNVECSKVNDASNMRAFRCQLPRENRFYSSLEPVDPDQGDVPDPFAAPDYPHLCDLCGCWATKKCARCENAWYCCRDHQAIDWSTTHKKACGVAQFKAEDEPLPAGDPPTTNSDVNILNGDASLAKPPSQPKPISNGFLFGEYGIEMDTECLPHDFAADDSDEDDDEDDDEGAEEERMHQFRQYTREHREESDFNVAGVEEIEDSLAKDRAFKVFNKVVALNPEQVLRYDRGGTPLLATDSAAAPNTVPNCVLCGAARQFEMQLMPHLVSLIGVDSIGHSIDWATVMLFTCANNCQIPEESYAEEFLFKQDFC